ncbi:hypothetical protein [Paraflavitalea pollutisoli]|uniref:hypothetical protein n=1 Tax=Paraflavitalea pollutisoli TaxID=3034143 RepID=UPI0023EDE1AE|nr:hypothetical protein [Paraflavitalea sp. H1-2-19X]
MKAAIAAIKAALGQEKASSENDTAALVATGNTNTNQDEYNNTELTTHTSSSGFGWGVFFFVAVLFIAAVLMAKSGIGDRSDAAMITNTGYHTSIPGKKDDWSEALVMAGLLAVEHSHSNSAQTSNSWDNGSSHDSSSSSFDSGSSYDSGSFSYDSGTSSSSDTSSSFDSGSSDGGGASGSW